MFFTYLIVLIVLAALLTMLNHCRLLLTVETRALKECRLPPFSNQPSVRFVVINEKFPFSPINLQLLRGSAYQNDYSFLVVCFKVKYAFSLNIKVSFS